jgi:high-affinity K+ transport system ATPase subunit B
VAIGVFRRELEERQPMSVVVEDVHIIYQTLDHVTGTPVVMEEDLRMGGVVATQDGLGPAVKEVGKINIGIGSFIHSLS